MNIHRIEARDLPDLWFQAVNDILDQGRRFLRHGLNMIFLQEV